MLAWIFTGLLALAPTWADAQLSFEQALSLATHDTPAVQADTARIAALRAQAIPADALPDPKLVVGLDNLPITGRDSFSLSRDFMTMQKVGIQQAWTNRAKREARRHGAEAKIGTANATALTTRLKLRRDAALAWLEVYYAERKLAALRDLSEENTRASHTVPGQVAAGALDPVAALAPEIDTLELADRHEALAAERDQARVELARLIGAAAELPLSVSPPHIEVEPAHLRAHVQQHPELLEFASRLDEARAAMTAAAADKRPDWDFEVAYAHRGPEYGDMISAEVSIDLPLFAEHRQDPLIAARLQDLAALEAERAQMLRDHAAALERGLVRHARDRQRLVRYQTQRLPLAKRRATLAAAAYAAGSIDLETLLDTRGTLIETRLELLDATAAVTLSAADLYYTYEGGEHDAHE
ncbi:MAG: hypothetical protein EXR86_03580 [Gammaproteobacteria bacterium]|nr:hypothetical protein [Gammaproteobacteria bacterium]